MKNFYELTDNTPASNYCAGAEELTGTGENRKCTGALPRTNRAENKRREIRNAYRTKVVRRQNVFRERGTNDKTSCFFRRRPFPRDVSTSRMSMISMQIQRGACVHPTAASVALREKERETVRVRSIFRYSKLRYSDLNSGLSENFAIES